MGYYASYGGYITLKEAKDLDEVLRLIEKSGCFEEFEFGLYPNDASHPVIDVSGHNKYYEYELTSLYEQIGKYVKEASIEFVGEDETYWKHTFEDGEWKEYSGKIVYENPSRFAGSRKEDDKSLEEEEIER